jgi:penicillin-binding protein 2
MFSPDPNDAAQRRLFSRRLLVLGGLKAAGFAAVTGRLWQLQVQEHGRYGLLAAENRISVQVIGPTRGRILDRTGTVLAANDETYRAVLLPALARDVRATLERMRALVPIEPNTIDALVQRARRQPPTVPLVVANQLTFDQIATLGLHAPVLPGVTTEHAPRRRYVSGTHLGHVVGHVGALVRPAMDDDPVLRLPGQRVGRAGVEATAEAMLRGGGGLVHAEVDSRGHIVRHLERREPIAGRDIVTTIDAALQADVAAALAAHRRASAVVMHIDSGDVVALVSQPGFDPNTFRDGGDRAGIDALRVDPDSPLQNRATRGLYPPGSTFKMVVALAALEAGVLTPTEKIGCDGRYDYFDQTFRCWKRTGHGACDLHRAIVESCDCYFYEAARRTGISAIAGMARRMGLGQRYPAGVIEHSAGVVPDPDWKRGRFGKRWLGGETILAGIGQGYMSCSPLQLAVMTARLASGRSVMPCLLRPLDQTNPSHASPAALVTTRIDGLALLRRAMHDVVHDSGGTGHAAQQTASRIRIAGKTGTSQVSRHSSETAQLDLPYELRDHALFVAFAPAAKPTYALAVVVEHGGGGGAVAAPVAREIIAAVLARDPAAASGAGATPAPATMQRG